MIKKQKTTQTSDIRKLARRLRSGAKSKTWLQQATEENILDAKGIPSAALAWRIAHGYQPGLDVCRRLHVRATCPTCKRKIPRVLPEWVMRGADFLAEREREKTG